MACPNFEEKTFAGGSKTAKFVNVFSLESFPLYGNSIHLAIYGVHSLLSLPTLQKVRYCYHLAANSIMLARPIIAILQNVAAYFYALTIMFSRKN